MMKIYSSIDDALKRAVCAGYDGELTRRSSVTIGVGKGEQYPHICHEQGNCTFKTEGKRYDFCTYAAATRAIPNVKEQKELMQLHMTDPDNEKK